MNDMIERFEGKLETARQELNNLSTNLEVKSAEFDLQSNWIMIFLMVCEDGKRGG